MSDIHKLTFIEKRERLKNSVFKSLHDVSEFLGRVLLHATIRQHHESQPIPCMLYVEKAGAEKFLKTCISFAAIQKVISFGLASASW